MLGLTGVERFEIRFIVSSALQQLAPSDLTRVASFFDNWVCARGITEATWAECVCVAGVSWLCGCVWFGLLD